jgi:hypothetical protein
MDILLSALDELISSAQLHEKNRKYADDPVEWCRSAFGDDYVSVIPKLQEAQRSLASSAKFIACYSSNAVGKSFTLGAEGALWWVYGRGVANAQVLLIAGGSQQVKKFMGYCSNLIGVNHNRYEQGKTNVYIDGRVIDQSSVRTKGLDVILGRNPRQTENNKQAVLGAHSLGGTLVIFEEADGISKTIFEGGLRSVTGAKDKALAITNPNDPDSYIGMATRWYEDMLDGKEYTKNQWEVFQVGWKDMPTNPENENYNLEISDEQRNNLLSKEAVDNWIDMYGVGSVDYNIKILGRWDYAEKRTLITQKDINDGVNAKADLEVDFITRPVLGIDLALFGKDNTVIYMAYDVPTAFTTHTTLLPHECTNECITETKNITYVRYLDAITDNATDQQTQAKYVSELCKEHDVCEVRFDAAGLGAPFYRTLEIEIENSNLDTRIIPFIGSKRDFAGASYENDRAYWWGKCKELLIGGRIDLDENDELLIKELKSIGYKINNKNQIILQSKNELPKSPDYADSFILAIQPRENVEYMLNMNLKSPDKIVQMEDVDPEFRNTEYDEFGLDDSYFDDLDFEIII